MANATEALFFNASGSWKSAQPCKTVWMLLAKKKEWTLLMPVRVGFISIYVLIFMLGLTANLAMIYTIIKHKRHKKVTNFFLMHLGICDVLLCVTSIPMAPLVFFAYNWHLGSLLCKLMPYCQVTAFIVMSLILSSIALDRFRNIVHPQKRNWGLATAKAITAGIWAFVVIFNAPIFFAHKLIVHKNICGEFCMEIWSLDWFEDHHYGIINLALTYVVPMSLQCFFSLRILIKVRRDIIRDLQARSHSPHNPNAATRKHRVTYTLMLMMIAFAFSFLPLIMLNLLRDWNVNWAFLNYQPFMFQLTAHCIAMTCVVWNPVLFFWMSKTHRQALRSDILSKISIYNTLMATFDNGRQAHNNDSDNSTLIDQDENSM